MTNGRRRRRDLRKTQTSGGRPRSAKFAGTGLLVFEAVFGLLYHLDDDDPEEPADTLPGWRQQSPGTARPYLSAGCERGSGQPKVLSLFTLHQISRGTTMPGLHPARPAAARWAPVPLRHRAAIGVATASVLAMAVVGLAAPASAAPPVSTPVLGVVNSGGDAVAENGVLTIDPIVLNISGVARTVLFTVHIELSDTGSPQPFQFLNNGNDACRQPGGTTSGLVLDCQYPLPVDDQGDATLTIHPLTITPITAASFGSMLGGDVRLSITGDVGGTAYVGHSIQLHRHAHLTVSAPDSINGHVGDVVDVPWTATNTGPDELPGAWALFTLTAPSGTEWTGPAAAQCDPPVVPKSKYVCTAAGTVLAPSGSLAETWQLKIVSDVVGTGHITAQLATAPGPTPPITDPKAGQGGDAAINIKVLPGPPASSTPTPTTSSPATEPLKPARPTPTSPVAALPTTGLNLAPVGAIGMLALIVGGILLAATRRRRKISNNT